MFYCDSSALTKLLKPERDSQELVQLFEGNASLIGSALLRTELVRAMNRYLPQYAAGIYRVLERVDLIPVDVGVLDAAGRMSPPSLRSLDAIHLASALTIREELEAFVAYDVRLLEAASALGLPVASPGLDWAPSPGLS